jgi:hypothetical protein
MGAGATGSYYGALLARDDHGGLVARTADRASGRRAASPPSRGDGPTQAGI